MPLILTLIFFVFFDFRVRSPSPEIVREGNPDESLYDLNGELREIFTLPQPLPSEEAFPKNRIPSPIVKEKEELNLDYVRFILNSKVQSFYIIRFYLEL